MGVLEKCCLRPMASLARSPRCFEAALRDLVAMAMVLLAFSLLSASGAPAPAQVPMAAPAPAPAVQENRYLLIVDVSKAMLPRSAGSLEAIGELLATGMDAQIRQGDALALWTFSEDVYAGRFPILHWSAADQGMIGSRILTYLRDQTIGKVANLDKLMLATSYVIKDSQCATVIIITDGEQKFHGTPFDKQINESLDRLGKKQKKAKMPFVIVLRAENGMLTDYAVSTPPRPIRVPAVPALTPPTPPGVQFTKTAGPESPSSAVEVKKLVPGAMVFSGANPKPLVVAGAPVTPPAPAPAKPEIAARNEAQPAPRSIEPPVANNVVTPPIKVEASQPSARVAVVATEAPSTPLVSSEEPAQDLLVQPALLSPELAKSEDVQPAVPLAPNQTVSPSVSSAPLASNSAPKPEVSNVADTKPAPTPGLIPAAAVAAAVASMRAQAEVAKSPAPEVKTNTAPAPVSSVAAPIAPAVASPAVPVAVANVASLHPGELHPVNAHPHPHTPSPMGHSQVAVVAPQTRWMSGWMFWAAAILLAATAISCSLLILRRSRPAPSASLITCSFDRK